MPEYEDEDARTIFCANISENVTDVLLYELFLQGGPVEKISIPKDQDGRARSFGFITYVHAISVPYAVSLFQGTKLFNRELTIKPRNNKNSNIQQRPDVPVLSHPSRNPFDLNSNENSRFDRKQPSKRPDQPIYMPNPLEQSSLRSGFNHISTKASMLPQPSKRSNSQQPSNPFDIKSFDALLSMGQMLQPSSRQSATSNRPTYDMRFLDRDSRPSNSKITHRQNNRPHHRDQPYLRRNSPPRRQHGSGSDRRRR